MTGHGKPWHYRDGCRCELCKEAKRASMVRYRAGRRLRDADLIPKPQRVTVHGTWRGMDVDAAIARAADAMFTTVDDHRQHRSRETA